MLDLLYNILLLLVKAALAVAAPAAVWSAGWTLASASLLATVLLCRALGTHRVLRLPVGTVLCGLLVLDLILYAVVRILTWLVQTSRRRHRREAALEAALEAATSYEEWVAAARSLDAFERRDAWRAVAESELYDWRTTQATTLRLREAREARDGPRLMAVLLPCCKPNVFGLLESRIYSEARAGTKQVIEAFVSEVCASLAWLADGGGGGAAPEAEVRAFLLAARASLGNPALLLSGGAILSIYQFGVVKALLELGCLPKVVSGSSGGAVIATLACCWRDDELLALLREAVDAPEGSALYREMGSHGPLHGSRLWKVRQLLRQGRIYDWQDFAAHMQWFSRGLTFAEAHARTGRVLNITCTPLRSRGRAAPPLMLNHIDTPHVDIASAVCASACIPGLIQPVWLLEKAADGTTRPYHQPDLAGDGGGDSRVLLRDGSFEADVPVHQIAAHFGMSFAIVAQVNPHVVPFYAHLHGRPGRPSGGRARTGAWRGGFLLGAAEVSLKEDLRKQLRTLQALRLDWKLFGCDWSHMWLQPQDPHIAGVTLTCEPRLADYADIVGNLTHPEQLRRMVRSMERNTWEAAALIRTHMRVEEALAAALHALGVQPRIGTALLYSPTRGLAALAPHESPPPAAGAAAKAAPRRRPQRSPARGRAAAA